MEQSSLLGESKAFPNKVAYEKKIFCVHRRVFHNVQFHTP